MQKMFVLGDYHDYEDDRENLDELNSYLSDGWKVVNMQAVSTKEDCVCYILIEKHIDKYGIDIAKK
ncbi:MAG: hypothetical protein K2O29_08115 [Ruminococcus sp.]|nr:hypothetical protein [Ruminococcus sp.]MDE7138403.1 hypothetical protein [Ruminococcus sp.]